jgi:hypothetical protein
MWGCAMRLKILALLLSAGTAALCQTATPAAVNPEQHWLTAPGMSQPGFDITRPPQDWHFNSSLPRNTIILPGPGAPFRGSEAQIDPMIVLHPPQASLGAQPPGTQIAQNLYPGLLLMPVAESKLKAEPIPTTWPNLKVQQIPIVWPKLEIKQVESEATSTAARK